MKSKHIVKRKLAACLIVIAALALIPVCASATLFTGSSGSLAASVMFGVSGSDLLVTLVNTSTGDPAAPGDILSGVIFSLPGNLLLTQVSATLSPGSSVFDGPAPATDPGGGVGGEWAYTNSLAAPFTGQQSIYSSGYFDGLARFPGSDLQGPPSGSVAGIQYGITTVNDTLGNDNGGLSGQGLIQNSVDFVLGGLPNGFDLNSISGVSFQYGTDLSEINFPGTPGITIGGGEVPEPSTLLLIGSGLIGLGIFRRRLIK